MTHVRLAAAQQAPLQQAMRVLLTPGAHSTLNDWQLAANGAVKRVVGADAALFVSFCAGDPVLSSEESPRAHEYVPYISDFDSRIGFYRRQEEQTVWSRRSLWGEHLGRMLRSSYYNELVRPERWFDSIGLTVRAADLANSLGTIHLVHDSERGPRFGRRGRALLWLLEPCFRIGFENALRHFSPPNAGGATARPDQVGGPAPSSVSTSCRLSKRLTRREQEVVHLLSRRRSNREIAEMIGVSRSTAKRHTENILGKLGLRSRFEVERVIVDE